MTARKQILWQLPVPSTALSTDAFYDWRSASLRFEYRREGILYRAGIAFEQVVASCRRAERCCTTWHIEVAYDSLVEVLESGWAEEIRRATHPMWRDRWPIRHFLMYVDSAGAFEFVAADWKLLPELAVE
jgi:hypothetical protein